MSVSADIERSSNNRDRLDGKIRARKAVEERLKRKMGKSSDKLLPSRDNTAIRHKSILEKKMRESVPSESSIMSRNLESFEDCDNPTSPVESHLHTVKDTFEQRMKKKMSESSPPDVSQKMKEEGSCEELIKREGEMNGFDAVPNNNATERSSSLNKMMSESTYAESISPVKHSPANDLFEQRLKKNMSESSHVMPMDPSNPKPVPLPSNAIPEKK